MDSQCESPTLRVVKAVASELETDPLELPPLGEAVDPDALTDVIESSASTTIQFTYADHTITVRSDQADAVAVESEACDPVVTVADS